MKFPTLTKNGNSEGLLDRVRVRLLEKEERERFDQYLVERHYLKSSRLGGQHMRYVAEIDGRWVALVAYSGASPHLKGREELIGWSSKQLAQRLPLVVNNSRFLILEEKGSCPNLASKVLSMTLRRLSNDWQRLWGHPVAVVESFVDEGRYEGTCYRACGFEQAGQSAGFSRDRRDYYVEHGTPKALYLKELQPGAFKELRAPKLAAKWKSAEVDTTGRCSLPNAQLGSLFERLRVIKDQRTLCRVEHRLASTLACAAVATLLGGESYKSFEDISKRFSKRQLRALGCPRDEQSGNYVAPSDSTFFRVLRNVDPQEFEAVVRDWLLSLHPSEREALAVDGKVLCGSKRNGQKPLGLLSIATHDERITLASVPIEEKSNEITAFASLLEGLDIEGCVITADSMHCQQKHARLLTNERGADYIFGLKGNQSGIFQRAQSAIADGAFSPSTRGDHLPQRPS